ncbi:MAG: hypothetical protein ACRC2S_09675 [Waterburya sp.]
MKILILEANPHQDLKLDKEIRELTKVINESSDHYEFQIKDGAAVQTNQIHKLMLEFEDKEPKEDPIIVHFCGHGTGEQGLIFENEKGGRDLVSTETLANFFELFQHRIVCVVMNACYSDVQAEAISKHIDYVIGMNQAIRDDAAIAFSIGFYRALGYGKSIENAYKFGCNAIQLAIEDGSKNRDAIAQEVRKLVSTPEIPKATLTQEHLKPVLKINLIVKHPNTLIESLKKIFAENNIDEQIAKRTYHKCIPKNWFYQPADSLERIFIDLDEFPYEKDEDNPILKFIVLLINEPQLAIKIREKLRKWGEFHVGNFNLDLSKFKEICDRPLPPPLINSRSYLMIQIRSSQQNSNRYFVEAWFIPNSSVYKTDTGFGCHRLQLEGEEKVYSLAEIPIVIKKLLNLSGAYSQNSTDLPILEFFLSTELLNQDIDRWEIDDDDNLCVPIGFQYQVVVRSYERLLFKYQKHLPVWKQKWDNLKQFGESICAELFVNGDEDWRKLMVQLDSESVFGVMLTKTPDLGTGSPLSVIQRTATPIAVWTRADLENIDSQQEINDLLQCLVKKLRSVVREKRKNAFPQPQDQDLGHHLSLLWEDPYRLPPKMEYSDS